MANNDNFLDRVADAVDKVMLAIYDLKGSIDGRVDGQPRARVPPHALHEFRVLCHMRDSIDLKVQSNLVLDAALKEINLTVLRGWRIRRKFVGVRFYLWLEDVANRPNSVIYHGRDWELTAEEHATLEED